GFYQNVDVEVGGLVLSRPVLVPIRNARVEVVSRSKQSVVAVSETDDRGRFDVPAPFGSDLAIRISSRLRNMSLRVADNTNLNSTYSISAAVDNSRANFDVLVADRSRVSGAFNILEM